MPGDPLCRHPADDSIYRELDWETVLAAEEHSDAAQAIPVIPAGADVNYLALSGGGADGAFGAGVLNGWSSTLPEFQVVTGISAGAVLATHAFVGDVAPLQKFGNIRESELVGKTLLPFLFSPAYYSNKPLRELMDGLITDAHLAEVANKAGKSLLAVGVVSLDSGRFVSVNLTEIASLWLAATGEDRKRYRKWYVEAVVASAAIPLAMPPSYLSCEMMVDGGVRAQVYTEGVKAAMEAATGGSEVKVYALINGRIRLTLGDDGMAATAKAGLEDIATRSVKTLLNASENNDIYRLCTGPLADHLAFISMDQLDATVYQDCQGKADSIFDGEYMACVYNAGLALAQDGGIGSAATCAALP